jgi:hypothetical protein
MDKLAEYILCAAIHYKTGDVTPHSPKNITSGVVICGRRHHNCCITKSLVGISNMVPYVQGFVTSKDRFVDREEGALIALAANQVQEDYFELDREVPCLISEDLY